MIKSMTGFGQSACEINGLSCVVEIKTVNNRYFKSRIKLPEMLAFLEDDIDKLLRNNLYRGTVNYAIKLKNVSGKLLFDINDSAMEGYIQKLTQAVKSTGIDYQVNLVDLLSLPGVMEPSVPDEEKALLIKQAVLDVTQQALEDLVDMRTREGRDIAENLKNHCQKIKQLLDGVQQRCPVVLQEYREKLQNRLELLMTGIQLNVDQEILAREVAIFADHCDISEEIARLDSHLQQFLESCDKNEHAGRRFDFICQEMLREANTIASKSADSEIGHAVVDIKCLIDRLKEQVQNVE